MKLNRKLCEVCHIDRQRQTPEGVFQLLFTLKATLNLRCPKITIYEFGWSIVGRAFSRTRTLLLLMAPGKGIEPSSFVDIANSPLFYAATFLFFA